MTLTAQDRARRIKIILFDVDGVLTDGTIWLVPAPNPASSSAETRSRIFRSTRGRSVSACTRRR